MSPPFGEFPQGSSAAAAAAAVVPSNLIVGGASETVPTIKIPGLSGSPDIIPGSPSAFNDEFDQAAAGIPAGWSRTDTQGGSWGSLTTLNTSDFLSNLHIACGAGALVQGIFKAAPTSLPFTMTVKLSDALVGSSGAGQFPAAGIWAASQAPGVAGSLFCLQLQGDANSTPPLLQIMTANSATGASAGGSTLTAAPNQLPVYFQITVTATTIIRRVSVGGYVFINVITTSGLTNTNPFIGLFCNTNAGGQSAEAVFDWVRFK